jgi:hypothetical protein
MKVVTARRVTDPLGPALAYAGIRATVVCTCLAPNSLETTCCTAGGGQEIAERSGLVDVAAW